MATVSVNYTCVWQHKCHPHYQWTSDGICVNVRTGRILRKKYQSGTFGFNINGRFTSVSELRKNIVRIQEADCPF